MRRRTLLATTTALSGATVSPINWAAALTGSEPAMPSVASVPLGVNLAGMEYNGTGVGGSNARTANQVLYHGWTPPTEADVAYVASLGMNRIRLPFSWELLQPVLYTTTFSIAGAPGALEPTYLKYISNILDACAKCGVKCVLDLHNYARYVDYLYQANGSILTAITADSRVRYVQNPANRVFKVLGDGALTGAHLADFWSRIATQFHQHEGLGGYGLMNEPTPDSVTMHPTNGELVAALKAAIMAIRAVDKTHSIYVPGDQYSAPARWSGEGYGLINPGYPLPDPANNIIYEAHVYLDHAGSGSYFDWEYESTLEAPPRTSKNIPAEKTSVATGARRIQYFIDWLKKYNVKGALTEIAMPADSYHWQTSYLNALKAARLAGIEVYAWQGGRHWIVHNMAISVVPNVAQGIQQHAHAIGPTLAAANVEVAGIFDVGSSYSASGRFVITVYARGNLLSPVTLSLSDGGAGGTFSAQTITLPSGPNSSVQYVYTLPMNGVATVTYTASRQVPPPRRLYSLSNPVAYAKQNLDDGARCILAKYNAVEYLPGNSFKDLIAQSRSVNGSSVGAVWDSGYGATGATNATRMPGNELGVVAWQDGRYPLLVASNVSAIRFTSSRGTGLRRVLRKPTVFGGIQSSPSAIAPFGPAQPHFSIAAVRPTGQYNVGAIWAMADMQSGFNQVELRAASGVISACWVDAAGKSVQIAAPASSYNKDAVATLVSGGSNFRKFRLNGANIASNSLELLAGQCNHISLGVTYANYWTTRPFDGDIYGAVYGAGAPTDEELGVLEAYLSRKMATPTV